MGVINYGYFPFEDATNFTINTITGSTTDLTVYNSTYTYRSTAQHKQGDASLFQTKDGNLYFTDYLTALKNAGHTHLFIDFWIYLYNNDLYTSKETRLFTLGSGSVKWQKNEILPNYQEITSKFSFAENMWHHVIVEFEPPYRYMTFDDNKFTYNTNGDYTYYFKFGSFDSDLGPSFYMDELKIYEKTDSNMLIKDSSNKVYGFNNGIFGQVVADWTAMSTSDKETAFLTYGDGTPSSSDYALISSPFSIMTYSTNSTTPTATMTAIPAVQVVSPLGLIPIRNYASLDAVTATVEESGNGEVRMAVTTDLNTYKVYNSSLTDWETIATANIPTDGMTAAQLAAIPSSAWGALNADGIGVAYSLSMDSSTDTANVDALSITVDFFGELESKVQGTDYDYSYPANNVMHVKLYKSGDFKINYNPGT